MAPTTTSSGGSGKGKGKGKKRARGGGGGGLMDGGQRDYQSLLGLLLLDAETRAALAGEAAEEVEVLKEHLKGIAHLAGVEDWLMDLLVFQASLKQHDPGATFRPEAGLHFVLQGTLQPAHLPPGAHTTTAATTPLDTSSSHHQYRSASAFHSLPLHKPKPPLKLPSQAQLLYGRRKGDFFYVPPSEGEGEETAAAASSSAVAAAAAAAQEEPPALQEYLVPPKGSTSTLLLHVPLTLAQELMDHHPYLASAKSVPTTAPSAAPAVARARHDDDETEDEEEEGYDTKLPPADASKASSSYSERPPSPSPPLTVVTSPATEAFSSSASSDASSISSPSRSPSHSRAGSSRHRHHHRRSRSRSRSPSPSLSPSASGARMRPPAHQQQGQEQEEGVEEGRSLPSQPMPPHHHRASKRQRAAKQLVGSDGLSDEEIRRRAIKLIAERLHLDARKMEVQKIEYKEPGPGATAAMAYETVRRVNSSAPEMVLFHGTSWEYANGIVEAGFKKEKLKLRYGKEINHLYLGSDPRVAGQYARGWDDMCNMIVCKVLYLKDSISVNGCTGGSIRVLTRAVHGVVLPLFRVIYHQPQKARPPPSADRKELEVDDYSRLQEALTRHLIMSRGRAPYFMEP